MSALRLPFFRDLTLQTVLQEVAASLGGLVVVVAGAGLVTTGDLASGILPLLTILAMSAFLPISEIAPGGAAARRYVGRDAAGLCGSRRGGCRCARAPAFRKRANRFRGRASALSFDDVTFTYPGRVAPALENVSLDVPAGATLALVGPSGAGKTTIANLILRFWDPQAGGIQIIGARPARLRPR